MSFLPENLDDVQEPKAAPAGNYLLQVTACEPRKSGENSKHPGAPMFMVTLGFVEEPNVPTIRHFISLPYEDDENAAFKLLMLKRFLTLFNVPYTSDEEQLRFSILGAQANVAVGLSEPNENGDVYNNIQIPKMRNEPASGGRRRGR